MLIRLYVHIYFYTYKQIQIIISLQLLNNIRQPIKESNGLNESLKKFVKSAKILHDLASIETSFVFFFYNNNDNDREYVARLWPMSRRGAARSLIFVKFCMLSALHASRDFLSFVLFFHDCFYFTHWILFCVFYFIPFEVVINSFSGQCLARCDCYWPAGLPRLMISTFNYVYMCICINFRMHVCDWILQISNTNCHDHRGVVIPYTHA